MCFEFLTRSKASSSVSFSRCGRTRERGRDISVPLRSPRSQSCDELARVLPQRRRRWPHFARSLAEFRHHPDLATRQHSAFPQVFVLLGLSHSMDQGQAGVLVAEPDPPVVGIALAEAAGTTRRSSRPGGERRRTGRRRTPRSPDRDIAWPRTAAPGRRRRPSGRRGPGRGDSSRSVRSIPPSR